ncbi:SMC-Scp complex subunit ScpB [Planctomycetes bacterium K23_9]|uniref:Segregation and condensation protein B n=1 Tax=Stieleria marina TaxID=1930275 RepID=A0A517NPE3_9BACT|nr:hypothetical protein K239x_09260 [Planctomycetes bacterium K23_9]
MATWSSTSTTNSTLTRCHRLSSGAPLPSSRSSDNGLCENAARIHRPYAVTWGSATALSATSGPRQSVIPGAAAEQLWPDDEDSAGLRRQRAEAVLLMSKLPLSNRKLAQLAHLADATEARTLVRELNQVYDDHQRALRIELVAGGYRMMTRPALAPWLVRLGHLPPAIRLSSPMMETLAVVAYRQPVSRVNVEAIRGVACGELLRQLMERDLIRIAGRAEELGRPYLYGTTKRFLQIFGLATTDALPPIQWHALQEDQDDDSQTEDPPQEELSTSTKESDVSIAAAPVVLDAESEICIVNPVPADSDSVSQDPAAVIEDEEDDLYEGTGDFADDDEEDDDDEWDDDDDDWAEDDDDDDDDDDEDDDDDDADDSDDDDGLEDDEWEEVDDEDSDLEEDDDDVETDDEEFDDEDEEWDDDEDEDDDWDDEEEEEADDDGE